MVDEWLYLISFLTRSGIIIPSKWGLEKNFKDLVGTLINAFFILRRAFFINDFFIPRSVFYINALFSLFLSSILL